ncbi:MAG: dihydropteroate synthase [Bacteroidota bacterium]
MAHKAGSPDKGTAFSETRLLQCGTKQLDLSGAVVMGILNITPDSFFDGGKYKTLGQLLTQAEKMIGEGAAILDIGAVSTRPGAAVVSAGEEKSRLLPVLEVITRTFPETIISVDTYRSDIAMESCEMGAGIINDISGGQFDSCMFNMIREQKAAYVMMHIQGTPQTMQQNPEYDDVTSEIEAFFKEQLRNPDLTGKQNIILDPGFGFGKTLTGNYRLLNNLGRFLEHSYPLMVGFSRKSMISKVLNSNPEKALNGTTVLNTIALLKGASILRVHDVKEAMEAIKLTEALQLSGLNT